MFCKNCGNTLNEGDVFCKNCGNKVENNNETIEQIPPVDNSNQYPSYAKVTNMSPEPKKKSKLPIIIGIVLGLLALLLVVIVIVVVIVIIITSNGLKNQKELKCTSTTADITLYYSGDNIVGYIADGADYNLDEQSKYAKEIGIDAYLEEFGIWFSDNTDGYCTVDGVKVGESSKTSSNTSTNSNSNSTSSSKSTYVSGSTEISAGGYTYKIPNKYKSLTSQNAVAMGDYSSDWVITFYAYDPFVYTVNEDFIKDGVNLYYDDIEFDKSFTRNIEGLTLNFLEGKYNNTPLYAGYVNIDSNRGVLFVILLPNASLDDVPLEDFVTIIKAAEYDGSSSSSSFNLDLSSTERFLND